MPVFWDDDTSPSNQPRFSIPVYNVPPRGAGFICFLGEPTCVWCHWVPAPESRVRPCLKEECPHCPGLGLRREGFAPALLWQATSEGKQAWRSVVCHLTEAALDQVVEQAAGQQLRGRVFKLSRPGPRRNSRVEVELYEKPIQGWDVLPEAFDVRPLLLRLWGLRTPPASAIHRSNGKPAEMPPAATNGPGKGTGATDGPSLLPLPLKKRKRG